MHSRAVTDMEHPILITWLNDFIFCPISIYFHNLYGNTERMVMQEPRQINGSAAHERIDSGGHSTRANVLSGCSVFSEKYGLSGKIDIFNISTGELTERKKKIKTVYDGYVFQLYGQFFSLCEMGYTVKKLTLYSLEDNKRYSVSLPCDNEEMQEKFEKTVNDLKNFSPYGYKQENAEKCKNCIKICEVPF